VARPDASPASVASRPVRRVDILGVPVDALTVAQAVDLVAARAADRTSAACYATKPYVEFLDRAAVDPEVRDLLRGAEWNLPDGVALQWAAAYLDGRPGIARLIGLLAAIVVRPRAVTRVLPERFAGVSFTLPLLERCAREGLGVHLVGSPKAQSIEATARHLRERIPGLVVTGTSPGRFDDTAQDVLTVRLRAERPDVVLVGMGFPRQEQVMAHLSTSLEHGVLIGEGGTFDFTEFGGATRRAPSQLRRAGLEWLWRLWLEPSRWRRQLAIPRFVVRVWRAGAGR
jgi:N-acetylglucosaminyldiphosphoundecaprenol N-acetyl-beta-D-mannosaminyltransferase